MAIPKLPQPKHCGNLDPTSRCLDRQRFEHGIGFKDTEQKRKQETVIKHIDFLGQFDRKNNDEHEWADRYKNKHSCCYSFKNILIVIHQQEHDADVR